MTAMNLGCCICLEEFTRDVNPPVSCGHNVCRPCLTNYMATQRRRTCPLCRERITAQMPNRDLMDVIEASAAGAPPAPAAGLPRDVGAEDGAAETSASTAAVRAGTEHDASSRDSSALFKLAPSAVADSSVARRRTHELIRDDTERIFCVIDNSGSMRSCDGKIFQAESGGRLRKRAHGSVTRWEEAGHKCLQVARYNLKRGVPATYYLLNPNVSGRWTRDQDFVEVGPDDDSALSTLQQMLCRQNIRGTTPLDQITRHLRQQISAQGGADRKLCYVLFTDGEPNSKLTFEQELRHLATDARSLGAVRGQQSLQVLFLTVNLCTDTDEVVEYYNDLDQKLGNELSGMDVLDDLEAEQREVIGAGNKILTYCEELHICRMAGCHSVIADLLDERPLSMFHAAKVIKEVLKLDMVPDAPSSTDGAAANAYDALLWLEDTDAFLQLVQSRNFNVFDFRAKRLKPIVDVEKLKNKIWWYKLQHQGLADYPWVQSWRDWFEDNSLGRLIVQLRWALLVLLLLFLVHLAGLRNVLLTVLGADKIEL